MVKIGTKKTLINTTGEGCVESAKHCTFLVQGYNYNHSVSTALSATLWAVLYLSIREHLCFHMCTFQPAVSAYHLRDGKRSQTLILPTTIFSAACPEHWSSQTRLTGDPQKISIAARRETRHFQLQHTREAHLEKSEFRAWKRKPDQAAPHLPSGTCDEGGKDASLTMPLFSALFHRSAEAAARSDTHTTVLNVRSTAKTFVIRRLLGANCCDSQMYASVCIWHLQEYKRSYPVHF